jgi:fatty-acyl-CoA synthase
MYPGVYSRLQPDKVAVWRPSTGEGLTYAELDRRSNQLAQYLRAQGVKRGDHLACFLDNQVAFFEIIWACMRSGLYFTAINHHLAVGEAAYIVEDCDAIALIASANFEQSAELGRVTPACGIKLAIAGEIDGFANYEQALSGQPFTPLADESVGSVMLYSSGTTGRPKGIIRPLPEGPISEGIPGLTSIINGFGLDGDTVYLCPAPLYHAAPSGWSTAVQQVGGTVVLMDRFDAEMALQLIERYRVTHAQFVPAMFIRMLKLDPELRDQYDLASVRMAIHSAAPCPVEVKRRMIEWWGPVIYEYYSSTESAGFARISSEEWLEHPGSVGRSLGAPFHICDDDGNELPAGQPGLIYGESPTGKSFSYHKDDGKTHAALHPAHPGWITVGDIGYLDENGFLYLTDRKSFMIISGGVNIYPQQIENVLAMHPALTDVAVIGVPNEDLGEEVKAVVQLAAGVEPSDALAAQLMALVTAELGKQLTPRSVDFVDELPRTPTGKLLKKELRDKYWLQG